MRGVGKTGRPRLGSPGYYTEYILTSLHALGFTRRQRLPVDILHAFYWPTSFAIVYKGVSPLFGLGGMDGESADFL